MKTCLSTYMLGREVEATEIEAAIAEGSFTLERVAADLGLRCPLCDEAVKFRPGAERNLATGKSTAVSPFFYHHRSVPETIECDRRILTVEGREKMKVIQRQYVQQRLKLYNEVLWQMAAADRNASKELLSRTKREFGAKWCEDTARAVRRTWGKQLSRLHGILEENSMELLTSTESLAIAPDGSPSKNPLIWEESQKQAAYFGLIDLKAHLVVCHEIIDFLAARTGGYAFEKIFVATLMQSTYIMRVQENLPSHLALQWVKGQSYELFTANIIGFVMGTHWIDQIKEKLPSL